MSVNGAKHWSEEEQVLATALEARTIERDEAREFARHIMRIAKFDHQYLNGESQEVLRAIKTRMRGW